MNPTNIILGTVLLNSLMLAYSIAKPRLGVINNSTKGKRALLLDSCSLIDGRIIELAQAGFTPSIIIIPAFIIRELQMLADGSDSHKRERARFGLDVANSLKGLAGIEVIVDRRPFDDVPQIDDKLIVLARQEGAQLYTTDFNLAKVAEVEGVKVLNVNELAQRLRPNILPGESMDVKIIQKGSSRGQGVGYADDGTMVVVEQAYSLIGQKVNVVVDRMHNTLAGKMIFAKLPETTKLVGLRTKAGPKPRPTPRAYSKTSNSVKQATKPESQFVEDLLAELS
jgi:uncharacterized protein YacL